MWDGCWGNGFSDVTLALTLLLVDSACGESALRLCGCGPDQVSQVESGRERQRPFGVGGMEPGPSPSLPVIGRSRVPGPRTPVPPFKIYYPENSSASVEVEDTIAMNTHTLITRIEYLLRFC